MHYPMLQWNIPICLILYAEHAEPRTAGIGSQVRRVHRGGPSHQLSTQGTSSSYHLCSHGLYPRIKTFPPEFARESTS